MGYLPGGAAQLPGAARLEPRRRRDLLDRAGHRLVRHRGRRQVAGPLRLRQARRSQRALHPPAMPDDELVKHIAALLPVIPNGPADIKAKPRRGRLAATRHRLAGPQGARQDACWSSSTTPRSCSPTRPLALDDKASKVLDTDARRQIGLLIPRLAGTSAVRCCGRLEAEVRQLRRRKPVRNSGRSRNRCGPPSPGRTVSPPVFDVMHALGTRGNCRPPEGSGAIDRFAPFGRLPFAPRRYTFGCGAASRSCAGSCSLAVADRRNERHECTRRSQEVRRQQNGNAADQQQADTDAGAIRHHRSRRGRCRPPLSRHRLLHLRSRVSRRPPTARPRSPTSTATRAFCSTAAIRSISSPRQSNFIEVCYLLLNGELPTKTEFDKFRHTITHHTMVHEQMTRFYTGLPPRRASDGGHVRCGRRACRPSITTPPTSTIPSIG